MDEFDTACAEGPLYFLREASLRLFLVKRDLSFY